MASYGDSRYSPPSANVADIASQQGALLASRWRRLFAIWIDGFALYALGVPLARAGLVDCVMIFRKSRRCLHDEIADTIVVRA
jgi:hypothetical protein